MKFIQSNLPKKDDREEWLRGVIQQYMLLAEKTVRRTGCGYLSDSDIEEIVGDVFYEVWKAFDRYDCSKGSMTSFIMTIAKRKTIDRMRKITAETVISLDEELLLSSKNEAEAAVISAESRSMLLRAIAGLGEPDATIVLRRYYFGESYREIAKRVGMTENATNKRCLNALKKLKQIFVED